MAASAGSGEHPPIWGWVRSRETGHLLGNRGAREEVGRPVDFVLLAVAEKLAQEFPDTPSAAVVEVVTQCEATNPETDPMFIEQAARARLTQMGSQP